MNDSMYRYFKREKVTLQCEVVTPMFLGNARQEAEWRAEPFKGLLRYWWRVTQHKQIDFKSLLCGEAALFGSAGEMEKVESKKSQIKVMVFSKSKATQDPLKHNLEEIPHPETKQERVDPLLYLAGMGLMIRGSVKHSYFPPDSSFELNIDYPRDLRTNVQPAFALMQAFGTIGSRCRNGWGSFQIKDGSMDKGIAVKALNEITEEWKNGFSKKEGFPNCLGKDEKGILLWKTSRRPSWKEVMKDLAGTYIKLRAGDDKKGIPKLDPGQNNNPAERHLLGVPLTNHTAWGQSARHASPLRFVVRRIEKDYIGFILHLPHKHSNDMPFPRPIDQIKVWDRIHSNIDVLLERATYEECI